VRVVVPLAALASALLLGGARGCTHPDVPVGRLPRDVVPLHYTLALRIDPAQEGFSGEVRIRVQVARPTGTIWLHGRNLEIESAFATPTGAGPIPLAAAIVHESGVLKLSAETKIPAGEALLVLAFRAPFDLQLDGTYKVTVDGRAYVMTQMEPIAARKSFPCFDEPAFKTPWDVSLVVPDGAVAVANTRQLREERLADGRVEHVFATTAPLPSYLIAYAVGPWDVVEGPPLPPTRERPQPIPLRGLAAAGRGPELHYALAETPRAVAALEAWFDQAYPFDKLDLLAAPDFAFGAMENAGLIAYQDRLLLVDEASATALRQDFLVTHLHELAHQWFGNSVTMPWWDDVWLNEAFATWLSVKLAAGLEPDYHAELHELEAVRGAMAEDSLASARRIAEPIHDFRDIDSAFDAITYEKGAAVLAMFEAYLGPARFQAAIRAHLRAHAGGTATTADLVGALAAAAEDPAAFGAAFRSFLEQPGVPLIEASSACRDEKPVLAVAQRRFLPLGSGASTDERWGLPLCVAHGLGTERSERCALLREPHAELPLADGACAGWALPNAGGTGYYRFALAPADRARLAPAFAGLDPREQLMLADSLDAAFETGGLTPADYLRAAREPAASPIWSVASAPLPTLDWMREQLAAGDARAPFDAWLRRVYGPRLAALGIDERPGEVDEARLERQALVDLLARAGDPGVRDALGARARAALAQDPPAQLPADVRGTALWVLAQDGTPAEFARLETALAAESDGQARRELVRALAAALAPERAAAARALALGPSVRAGEVGAFLGSHLAWESNRAAGRAWFRDHTDAVLAKLPSQAAADAPALYAVGACSEAEAREVDALFAAKVAPLEGGPRALAQLLEQIRLCAALRAHHARSGFGGALAEPSGSVRGSVDGP